MGQRTGRADLPLHGGRVPGWLAARMARLGRVVAEAIVFHYGPDELLRRLSHPFWFQAFGSVMGMDWHSSGITTSVVGALKRGLEPVASELGIFVCGGRGRHSRKTPGEINAVAERVGFDGDALGRCSRLVAKVDNAAVQDGFDLYLHSFVVSARGSWAVIQQGMNPSLRQARRYHWLSENLESYSHYDFVTRIGIRSMAKRFAPVSEHRNPLVSPVHADMTGLPPLLIQVGAAETLLDDNLRCAEAARSAGVDVKLEVWPDMIHAWHVFAPMLEEGRSAIRRIGEFVKDRTAE